jgi:hypothetical protein
VPGGRGSTVHSRSVRATSPPISHSRNRLPICTDPLTDDELLERLLALNLERAAVEQ